MNHIIQRRHHKIDASHYTLGRLVTTAIYYLLGKNKVQYDRSRDVGDFVNIINIDKVHFTGKKFYQNKIYHYSGYPGGVKEISVRELFHKNPQKLIRIMVHTMLPKNRLEKKILKRL